MTMRTRLALGLAGGFWGSRSVATAEKYSLTAGDFVGATAQELDEFIVPGDDNPEQRPRHPITWDDWLRRARRAVNIWALVYGEEWRGPLGKCLADLEQIQEDHPTVFPREVVMDIWEELHWRFWEEIRLSMLRSESWIRGRMPYTRCLDLGDAWTTPDGWIENRNLGVRL